MKSTVAGLYDPGNMSARKHSALAFTLVELLVTIAVISILAVLLFPAIQKGLVAANRTHCISNLRNLNTALAMYYQENNGRFFPYVEDVQGSSHFYIGFEVTSGSPGDRVLDMTRARLSPYFEHSGGVQTCPTFPYGEGYHLAQFTTPTYAYGLNAYMLKGTAQNMGSSVQNFDLIPLPAQTITWADCALLNTTEGEASPQNPMIQEHYILDAEPTPKFHFRHGGLCTAAFADGSVRPLNSFFLYPEPDGQLGYLQSSGEDYLLRLNK